MKLDVLLAFAFHEMLIRLFSPVAFTYSYCLQSLALVTFCLAQRLPSPSSPSPALLDSKTCESSASPSSLMGLAPADEDDEDEDDDDDGDGDFFLLCIENSFHDVNDFCSA